MTNERTTGAYAGYRDAEAAAEQRRFMVRVYNWMTAGLALTAAVAGIVASDEALLQLIFGNTLIVIGLVIAQLGLVFWLAARVHQMSAMTATSVFMGYSALTGLTFASIFVVYPIATVGSAFVVTAGAFGAMSVYGYTTQRDLTSWGSFLFMGLIGIVLASLVNLWMASPAVQWVVTYAGVLIFTGLTAYDTQKIKQMNILGNEGTEEDTKEAISGALALYLDFINLFLMILRVMGGNRD
ncbi:MAG: Bax inhibitor-1/YccA family protein [Nitrospinae bacterium]|nr:Bax inhibitor-1/YccA family protein [Nitrospinota bacterium]